MTCRISWPTSAACSATTCSRRHIDELVQLWDGKTSFASNTVNYSLSGERLDIQLKGAVLPGHEATWDRVLIAIEDVTERETARRSLAKSETYARGLFEHSPVSLWVEDFSAIKRLLDEMRERGIVDFRVFTDVHPEFVTRCMSEIRVIDVNRHTLDLFAAPDKGTLLGRLSDVFRDDMQQHFREQLIDLWDGKLFQQREVVNYSLDGIDAARAPAILGAARLRARLVAGAGRADRHHGAQEGRSLSRISRHSTTC